MLWLRAVRPRECCGAAPSVRPERNERCRNQKDAADTSDAAGAADSIKSYPDSAHVIGAKNFLRATHKTVR